MLAFLCTKLIFFSLCKIFADISAVSIEKKQQLNFNPDPAEPRYALSLKNSVDPDQLEAN